MFATSPNHYAVDAMLSDNGALPLSITDQTSGVYSITYQSSGPGQTLTVKLTMTSCDGGFCTSELYFAGLDQSASGSGTLLYTRDDFPE